MPNIFRGEEYPLHFQFRTDAEERNPQEGEIVGVAVSYLQVLNATVDELIEDNIPLIWSQGMVVEGKKK